MCGPDRDAQYGAMDRRVPFASGDDDAQWRPVCSPSAAAAAIHGNHGADFPIPGHKTPSYYVNERLEEVINVITLIYDSDIYYFHHQRIVVSQPHFEAGRGPYWLRRARVHTTTGQHVRHGYGRRRFNGCFARNGKGRPTTAITSTFSLVDMFLRSTFLDPP